MPSAASATAASPWWDAVVVGGGPAGAVAAWVLARAGLGVTLLHEPRGRYQGLGESLLGSARPLLRDLDLLDRVNAGPHLTATGNTSVWGSPEPYHTDFIHDRNGCGWHLDRNHFDTELRDAAASAGARILPAHFQTMVRDDHGWTVRVEETFLRARWVIDATGRKAAVARRLGVQRQADDNLIAVFAWYAGDDADATTRIEACPYGWWYTSRVPGGRRVVVLHLEADQASAVLKEPGFWERCLADTRWVGESVRHASRLNAPRGVAANGGHLDRVAGAGWLAVGDAALSFDPLSSQGIFNALYTGMKGAHAIIELRSQPLASATAYTRQIASIRRAYVQHWQQMYLAEGRWPNAPFWARRGHAKAAA